MALSTVYIIRSHSLCQRRAVTMKKSVHMEIQCRFLSIWCTVYTVCALKIEFQQCKGKHQHLKQERGQAIPVRLGLNT